MIDLREYITPNTPMIQKIMMEYNLQTVEDIFLFFRDQIISIPDEQDFWQRVDETILRGAGDCEDKSVAMLNAILSLNPNSNAVIYVFYIPERNENHAIILDGDTIYDPTFMVDGRGLGTGATVPGIDPFANPVCLWDNQQLIVYSQNLYENLL